MPEAIHHKQLWFTCGPSLSNLMLKWINKWIKGFDCHSDIFGGGVINKELSALEGIVPFSEEWVLVFWALTYSLHVRPSCSQSSPWSHLIHCLKHSMKEQKDSQLPECWIFQDSKLLFKNSFIKKSSHEIHTFRQQKRD